MADLTDKREALARAVGLGSMPAYRACLARVVRIDFDRHTGRPRRFIGNHALQLGKSPFGAGGVGFALLLTRLFALPLLCSFADVGQVFQPDQAVGETGHDACGNDMIGVGFQPSLPSGDHAQAARSRPGAFLLQTLSQSRVMVGLGDNSLVSRCKCT